LKEKAEAAGMEDVMKKVIIITALIGLFIYGVVSSVSSLIKDAQAVQASQIAQMEK
jgi:hypothetical protein